MANDTFYSLLGISETATAAEIKTAYLRLISEVHPDRIASAPAYWQRQAEEKCKEINEAYAVLSSDEKRRLYDGQLALSRYHRATENEAEAVSSDPPPPSSTQQHQAASSAPPQNDARTNGRAFHIASVAFILGFIAILAFAVIIGTHSQPATGVTTSQQESGNTSASQGSGEPPTNSWRYTKSTDEMTGAVSQTACLFSEDKLNGEESMRQGELCTYRGWRYPAVFKIGSNVTIPDLDFDTYPPVPGFSALNQTQHCGIRMRVDDKRGFEVCGEHDFNSRSEVSLYDSAYGNRGIPIMTVLKTAKIIKIELKADYRAAQIFTFKPDKPLDRKW